MHIVDDCEFAYNGYDMHPEFQEQLIQYVTSTTTLGDAERHLLQTEKAKFVRPAYVFACGSALGLTNDQLLNEAGAVELMHTGTLLHDDIIDGATERRGKASVNAKYGNKLAILGGDALFAQSLALLLNTPQPEKAVGIAAKTLMNITEAVAAELDTYQTKAATKEQLLEIVDGKTGALFALCGYLAGLAGNNIKAAEQFSHIGMLMGQVFQINDDIDDLEEDKRSNVLTIPLLLGEEAARAHVDSILGNIRTAVESLEVTNSSKQDLLSTVGATLRMAL